MPSVGQGVNKAVSNAASHEVTDGARMLLQAEKGFSPSRMISSITSTASNIAMGAMMFGGLLGFASKKAGGVKALKSVAPALDIAHKATGLFNVSVGELSNETGKVFDLASDAISHAGTKRVLDSASKVTQGAMTTTLKYAQNVLGKKAHGHLSNANVSNVVFAGANAVGEMASTAMSIGARISTLKAMQMDLTGKKVSTFALIFGGKDLDPMVAHARKSVVSGKALLSLAIQATGMVGNAYLTFKPDVKMLMVKSIGLSMGTSMAANALTSDSMLTAYRDMTKSFALAGKAGPDNYVNLIGGLAPNASEKVVTELAKNAFSQQLKAPEVLKMVQESFLNPVARKPVVGDAKFTANLAARAAAGRGQTFAMAGA